MNKKLLSILFTICVSTAGLEAGIMEEKSGENWLKGKLQAHEEFLEETARLDSPFHNKGVSTRELKALINARYSRIENRRRR